MRPVIKISSKCKHFRFSVVRLLSVVYRFIPQDMVANPLVPCDIRASAWLCSLFVASIRSSVITIIKIFGGQLRPDFLNLTTLLIERFRVHAYHAISAKNYRDRLWWNFVLIVHMCRWNNINVLPPPINFCNKDGRILEFQTVIIIFIGLIYPLLTHVWPFRLIESVSWKPQNISRCCLLDNLFEKKYHFSFLSYPFSPWLLWYQGTYKVQHLIIPKTFS